MERLYVLLVTAEEMQQVLKFHELGLDREQLAKATGELVSIPWEEFVHPLYCKIDSRAPALRFDYHDQAPPAEPPPAAAAPTPSPVQPVLPTMRVCIEIDCGKYLLSYPDLDPTEALRILNGNAR